MSAAHHRRWFIVGGLAAAVIFNAAIAVLFIALCPAGSALVSGLIGATVGGVVWWVLFMRLAASLERQSRRQGAE